MLRRVFLVVLLASALSSAGVALTLQAPPGAPPLVVLLDSAHPARIYDQATIGAGRTNADVLSDLLADLPIRRHAEAVSPDWQRDDEIRRMQPALVVVHYSGFNLADATGPRERLKLLITRLADTPIKFLVYSRADEADLGRNLTALLSDVYASHPGLADRVRAFGLNDYGPPQWINTTSAAALKRVVQTILGLPRRLVAIFVVDGLRPDSINATDTPTIARVRSEGAEYTNSHSIFPTVTRVNAASLATGAYPVGTGIVGNSMFAASVNPAAPFDTGDYTQLLKLDDASGRVVGAETMGEILQRHGRTLVTVSSGSTGNGFLLNPYARRDTSGVVIHGLFNRGTIAAYPRTVSDTILKRFGAPPPDPDDLGQMRWTDGVLRDYVLPALSPDVVIDWIGPLDSSQHEHGVSSPEAKEALRQIDASLAETLETIRKLGGYTSVDIIVTSDHGFAHHARGVNIIDALIAAGLKRDRTSADLIVASQSQSLLMYAQGSEPGHIARVVEFLQQQPSVGVIFTRGGRGGQGSVAGTFSFDLIQAAHPSRAPDIVVSLAWAPVPNRFGVPGSQTINSTTTGVLTSDASGHGGLSPWVVRNTLFAAGPDFKARTRLDAPASLPDLAPTVLKLLGIGFAEGPGRGRALDEALKDGRGGKPAKRTLTTSAGAYRARLEISSVGGKDYVDSGTRVP